NAVVAERMLRGLFGGGHLDAVTEHPDGAAMQKVLYLSAQTFDQLLGASESEGNHVNHDVRLQVADVCAENAPVVLCHSVCRNLLHGVPCAMHLMGLTSGARDVDDRMSLRDETRDEKGADVSTAANNNNTH